MGIGAYQLIKAANPAAVVLLGGLAANGDDKPKQSYYDYQALTGRQAAP